MAAFGTRRFGRLSLLLAQRKPPGPRKKGAFLRLAIHPRPGASKCRLNFRVAARAPTLDTGDILGLGPARSHEPRKCAENNVAVKAAIVRRTSVSHRPQRKAIFFRGPGGFLFQEKRKPPELLAAVNKRQVTGPTTAPDRRGEVPGYLRRYAGPRRVAADFCCNTGGAGV